MGNIVSAVAIRSDLNHVVLHVKKLMKNYQPLEVELGTWYLDSQKNYCLAVTENQIIIEQILRSKEDSNEVFVRCVVGQLLFRSVEEN